MTISAAGFARVMQYGSMFRQGLICTVLLSLFTVIFGFILALVLALMLLSKANPFQGIKKTGSEGNRHITLRSVFQWILELISWIFKMLAGAYVQFIRCTPVIVQIFIIYYVVFGAIKLPRFTMLGFLQFDRFFPGVVALSLNSGGYLSDVIRGGIEGVDAGQTEAARSLGMSKMQTMWHIVLPQAIKNILPAVANEFVTIIKESSICYTIGVQDIMFNINAVKSATFIIAEPLMIATALYFCLCFPTSKIIQYFERRMRQSDKR